MVLGNAVRDVELRQTPSGASVAEFQLAVSRKWMDNGQKREDVCFLSVVCFGKLAEIVGRYVTKGRQVFVEGRLHNENWTDKESGQKRQKTKVVAEQVQFLGGGRKDAERGDGETRGMAVERGVDEGW